MPDALRTAHATAVPDLSRCRTGDFNFFKDAFLNGADLLEANELQERQKRHHYFYARHGSSKQIRKTERSASRNPLQNRIDLLGNAKTLAKNFLYILARFNPFDHRLEGVYELKNPNFSQAQRFLHR